jgi:XTP/dITP diphosphohydrolase
MPVPSRLVLATENAGKVRELVRLVEAWDAPVLVQSLADHPGVTLPPETGETYEANAAQKAGVVAAATGLPALADDSGLEVDALGGAPGVRSARYGRDDADRIGRLLRELEARPGVARTARFRCVVVLAWPDGAMETGEGVVAGAIARHPRGAGGFGYDPVFVADELGTTFAEAPAAEKARVSHRARAMAALGERLGA